MKFTVDFEDFYPKQCELNNFLELNELEKYA